MKHLLAPLILSLGLGHAATVMACDPPSKPDIPNGSKSSEAQMLETKAAVDAYMAEGNAYLSCAGSTRAHNRMVESMEAVGLKFNMALRRYKKSQA